MATFTGSLYGNVFVKAFNKEIGITAGATNLKVMLCGTGYTPNKDTHIYKSSVTSEITGTGYTAGGQTLTGVTITYNTSTDKTTISFTAPNWPSSTLTNVSVFVLYDNGPATDATRPLIAYGVLDTPTSSSDSNFTITPNVNGVIELST